MTPIVRHNVNIRGRADGPTVVFGHGFGCDQSIWAEVAPAFESTHRVVLFDHVGSGGSDRGSFDHERHGTLDGYVDDLIGLAEALDLDRAIFVGHSVGSAIGADVAMYEAKNTPDRPFIVHEMDGDVR